MNANNQHLPWNTPSVTPAWVAALLSRHPTEAFLKDLAARVAKQKDEWEAFLEETKKKVAERGN